MLNVKTQSPQRDANIVALINTFVCSVPNFCNTVNDNCFIFLVIDQNVFYFIWLPHYTLRISNRQEVFSVNLCGMYVVQ